MNKNDIFITLTPSSEKLLCHQLEELHIKLPLDIYIKIKTIFDKCLKYHKIYYSEIKQILILLENINSPDHYVSEEEAPDNTPPSLPSTPQKAKSGISDHAHIDSFLLSQCCYNLYKTLKNWSRKCQKQGSISPKQPLFPFR